MQVHMYPIVHVTWTDACYHYDAEDLFDLPTPKEEHTVGHLLRQDDMHIVVAMTHDEFGYRAVVSIPRPYIEDIEYLATAIEEGEDIVRIGAD